MHVLRPQHLLAIIAFSPLSLRSAEACTGVNSSLGYVNVRNQPYCVGDPGVDPGAQIQQALNDVGNAGGGVVYLPTGNYLLNGTVQTLSVPPQTTLSGAWKLPIRSARGLHANEPPSAAPIEGTTLFAYAGQGNSEGTPFITLAGDNSAAEGLAIFYPQQTKSDPPLPYPWTIRGGGGDNNTVHNVTLVNPYNGIDFATNPSGRHLISSVHGQPLNVGIQVDRSGDVGRIKNIHFWPFWTVALQDPGDAALGGYVSSHGIAFKFLQADWEVVEDVFSWGYYIGIELDPSPFQPPSSVNNGMNGQMTNVNIDAVKIGIQVNKTSTNGILITNLNIASPVGKVAISSASGNSGYITIHNASFWGQWTNVINWNNPGLLSLIGGRFVSWDSCKGGSCCAGASCPAVRVSGGRVRIMDSFFEQQAFPPSPPKTAILVDDTAERCMLVGNELVGNVITVNNALTLQGNNHQ